MINEQGKLKRPAGGAAAVQPKREANCPRTCVTSAQWSSRRVARVRLWVGLHVAAAPQAALQLSHTLSAQPGAAQELCSGSRGPAGCSVCCAAAAACVLRRRSCGCCASARRRASSGEGHRDRIMRPHSDLIPPATMHALLFLVLHHELELVMPGGMRA